MRDMAMRYLEREPIRYTDMLEPLRQGTADVVAAQSGGILLYETKAGAHMLAADHPADARALLQSVDRLALATTHQDFATEIIADACGLRRTMCCRQAVWLHPQPPAAPQTTLAFRPLPPEMAQDIAALYSHDIGMDYIRHRLLAGELFGAFAGDLLAGFIGLHAEGSMGMLEVVPVFRRQGVATQLIAFLCARQLAAGRIPFSQFTVDNTPSQRLHEVMGFCIGRDCVYWLEG